MKRLLVAVSFAGTCVLAGSVLAATRPGIKAAIIVAVGITCVLPVGIRLVQRRFDLFEPLIIANLALVVMYVGRPSAIISSAEPAFYKGYDISGRIGLALLIAAVGCLALQIGYVLPWAGGAARRMSAPRGHWNVQMTVIFAASLATLACILFSLFLFQSGGLATLTGLLKGRSLVQDSYFRQSSAYLYSAPALFWPASLLLFALGLAERRRGFVVAGIVMTIPLGLFAGGQGSRITLIPLLLSPAIYYYLSRHRRPRPLIVLVAGYLLFTVGIAYFRETRTATEHVDRVHELQKTVTDPGFEYSQLVLHGKDNDMFESLAVETIVVPSRLPASPIDFLVRTLAKPIPSVLWKAKPVAPEEFLTNTLYPLEQSRASSSPGIIGSFYLMGLIPGVVIGMVLVGLLFRIPWEYWKLYPSSSVSQLFLTASLMFIPILLRGAVGDTIARALFGLAPLVLASRMCRSRGTARKPAKLDAFRAATQ